MEVFKLNKPELTAKTDRLFELMQSGENIFEYIKNTSVPQYLFWDKVRYKPRPKNTSPEEFWAMIKLLRLNSQNRVQTVVRDKDKNYFTWQFLPGQDYFLHKVDMQLGGMLESTLVEDQIARRRFISRGIMEEAIASSQLEGANTTRKVAKRMLIEKRRPINRSEQMILNNYLTRQFVEETMRHTELDKNSLFDLHVMLAQDTIESTDLGRFRTDADNVVVCDPTSNVVYHEPPPEKFFKKEMERLYRYANDESDKDRFVHPLIKAVILHFWIAYLHPFTDGNGRLARTIFYWYLLRRNYWAFSYLPISRVIRNSAAQYRDAYIYSEQDDYDLTYFIDYNIRKIQQAMRDFDTYVKRKQTENRQMAEVARSKYHLNDRQIQVLRYLHRNASATTSIKTHSHVNGISRMTARKDLLALEKMGFLISERIGKMRPFRGTSKTSDLFM